MKSTNWDVEKIRQDFPILQQSLKGKPLVYLDNASTTQKPQAVLNAMQNFYERENANVHRGVYALSERATKSYEGARNLVKEFIGAKKSSEVIF